MEETDHPVMTVTMTLGCDGSITIVSVCADNVPRPMQPLLIRGVISQALNRLPPDIQPTIDDGSSRH